MRGFNALQGKADDNIFSPISLGQDKPGGLPRPFRWQRDDRKKETGSPNNIRKRPKSNQEEIKLPEDITCCYKVQGRCSGLLLKYTDGSGGYRKPVQIGLNFIFVTFFPSPVGCFPSFSAFRKLQLFIRITYPYHLLLKDIKKRFSKCQKHSKSHFLVMLTFTSTFLQTELTLELEFFFSFSMTRCFYIPAPLPLPQGQRNFEPDDLQDGKVKISEARNITTTAPSSVVAQSHSIHVSLIKLSAWE